MPDDSVNIRIHKDTWKELREYKDEPGKTWDDVLNQLLDEREENENDSQEGDTGNRSATATAD